VDLKVVTGGVLERIGSEAALTYLFLCAVGNMQGVSCWSTWRTARLLGLTLDRVEVAIQKLAAADLIATNGRVIQVLPVESTVAGCATVQVSPAMVAPTPGSTDVEAVEVAEEELQVHEPEARRRLSKMTPRPSPASVHRVARALAIEARRNRCG
jgi:hypothetical protein